MGFSKCWAGYIVLSVLGIDPQMSGVYPAAVQSPRVSFTKPQFDITAPSLLSRYQSVGSVSMFVNRKQTKRRRVYGASIFFLPGR